MIMTGFKNYPSAEIEVFIGDKAIHLLDVSIAGTSLTNSIQGVQQEILTRLGLPESTGEYEWFLYHTDGVVTQWDTWFRPVAITDNRLYAPFVQEMEKRP